MTYPPRSPHQTYTEGETFTTVRSGTVRHFRIMAGIPLTESVTHNVIAVCGLGKLRHVGPCPSDIDFVKAHDERMEGRR